MNKRFSFGIVILVVAVLFVQGQETRNLVREGQPEKRLALVIGNGNYLQARTLANPVNDATDVATTLTGLGFEVISGFDLNLKQMNDKVREFGDKLKVNGGVGMFYYAGHGIQVGGKNFLIPVEADIPREDEVDFNALNLDFVLRKMGSAENPLNIVILDACRNNPFARSWSRSADEGGLAQITAPTGTFIAYATSPDRTASDGTGRNGLYTTELLKVMNTPNLKIEEAFKQVTIGVDRASGGKQIPWTSSSLRGEFYFRSNSANAAQVKPATSTEQVNPVTAAPPLSAEAIEWQRIKDSRNPLDFSLFLQKYPSGQFSRVAMAKLTAFYGGATDAETGPAAANTSGPVLLDGENRFLLKQALSKQDFNVRSGVMGIGGGIKYAIAINGNRSQIRTKNNKPEIEIVLANPNLNVSDVAVVVRLKSKSDQREIQTNQNTFSGFKKEDTIAITFEEIAAPTGSTQKLYRIKFPSALSPGEYALFYKQVAAISGIFGSSEISSGVPLGNFFDFAVDASK